MSECPTNENDVVEHIQTASASVSGGTADIEIEENQTSLEIHESTVSLPDIMTPKSRHISTQKRTILALRSKINRLKLTRNNKLNNKTIQQQKLEEIVAGCAFLPEKLRTLLTSQLLLSKSSKNNRRFSDDFKDIALSIFYHSPKTYRFLKTIITLPSVKTLRTYQNKFPVYTGFNETVLANLKECFEKAPLKDRAVSIMIDEISLTAEIHYDRGTDKFIGLVDDGTSRLPIPATSALVVMVTWLNKTMKQVVGYWLLGGKANSDRTHNVILDAVDKVSETGLIVKSVICDQGPRNQGFVKKMNITVEKPYFERKNHKIFFIFDPPHLIKSMRNNVMKKTLKYKGGYVYWTVLEKVFKLSRARPLNLIPKISEKHFDMSSHFSKMKVSLATQVFSESMYTALLVYKTMFPTEFPEKDDKTLDFIKDIDKLFDCMNSSLSRPTVPNKLNFAISENSGHADFMLSMLETLQSAKFVDTKQPPCLKGLKLSTNAVLQLAEDLRTNYDIPLTHTRRLNQDPLENLFAVVRQQHGCSVNPSPRQFEGGMRQIFILNLSKISAKTNCENDCNKTFAKLSKLKTLPVQKIAEPEMENIPNTFDIEDCVDLVDKEISDFGEDNAITYIGGFLTKKFFAQHSCETCKKILEGDSDRTFEDRKLFTFLKTYGDTNGLIHITDLAFITVKSWEMQFQKNIDSIIHSTHISKVLKDIIDNTCPVLELCSDDATNKFMQNFITIRCYWEARFRRRKLQCKSLKKQPVKSVATKNKKFKQTITK